MAQMAKYLQRREAWVLLCTHLIDIGILPSRGHPLIVLDDANPRAPGGNTRSDDDGGTLERITPNGTKGKGKLVDRAHGEGVELREWSDEVIWHPKPMISTAGNGSHVQRNGTALMTRYGATQLISATRRFLAEHTSSRSGCPLKAKHVFYVWHQCRLEHGRLPFLPDDGPQVDTIRATPQIRDEYGRITRPGAFDTVLFVTNPDAQGLHRKYLFVLRLEVR